MRGSTSTIIVSVIGILLFLLAKLPAQAATSTRLTIPLANNATVVHETKNGTRVETGIVSDALASTKVVVSSDGSTMTTPHYYPYGQAQKEVTNNPNDRYYTGQRKVSDDDSLYNYNARYYSPETGVFTQPDIVEGPNRFAYVGGNPIMNSDPSGHMSTGSEAYGGGGYMDLSSMSFKSFPAGVSFKDTINSYMPVPELLSGDPVFDTVANSFIGGVAAGAAAGGGYQVWLAASTACMGNNLACRAFIADIGVGDGSTIPVAPVPAIGRAIDEIPFGRLAQQRNISVEILHPEHLYLQAQPQNKGVYDEASKFFRGGINFLTGEIYVSEAHVDDPLILTHELGHLFAGHQNVTYGDSYIPLRQLQEAQASRFASLANSFAYGSTGDIRFQNAAIQANAMLKHHYDQAVRSLFNIQENSGTTFSIENLRDLMYTRWPGWVDDLITGAESLSKK